MKGTIRTFKDLVVWQKALELSVEIYRISSRLPGHELYGLTSELRKTSRSIAYNIAEGHKRGSTIEYIRFLRISAGSAAELESQILLAFRLGYTQGDDAKLIYDKLAEVEKILDSLIRSLRNRSNRFSPP